MTDNSCSSMTCCEVKTNKYLKFNIQNKIWKMKLSDWQLCFTPQLSTSVVARTDNDGCAVQSSVNKLDSRILVTTLLTKKGCRTKK